MPKIDKDDTCQFAQDFADEYAQDLEEKKIAKEEKQKAKEKKIARTFANNAQSRADIAQIMANSASLKSDRTEFLKIKDTFIRVALAHTDVGFELISDGKTILKVNKSTKEQGLDHQRTSTLIGSDFSLGQSNSGVFYLMLSLPE